MTTRLSKTGTRVSIPEGAIEGVFDGRAGGRFVEVSIPEGAIEGRVRRKQAPRCVAQFQYPKVRLKGETYF